MIFLAKKIVPDDFGRDEAEGDSVPAVAQREAGVWIAGVDSYVGEAIFRFTEGAGPGKSDLQRHIRKQPPEFFHQGSGLLRNQRVPALRIHEVLVLPTDDDAPFGGGAQIEVRRPLSQMRHCLCQPGIAGSGSLMSA